MLVLDTSALFYWTLDPDQLTEVAERSIDEADRLVVSSISIWEIALKVKRRALQIAIPTERYVEWLQQIEHLEIVPVDTGNWRDSVSLDWSHRDPADRVIVALARQLGCPLVTSDRAIGAFYRPTIW